MTKDLFSLLSQAKEWGVRLIHAPSNTPQEQALEVYKNTAAKRVLVGRLTSDMGEYVFRYASSYKAEPISAFPRKNHEYRSKRLWPFFAIRIPPLDREDMRREIAHRSLREDQVIEILGSVAKVSVSNPYEFKLGSAPTRKLSEGAKSQ